MTSYRYTSPYPAIFMDLTVGTKGLSVVYANKADEQLTIGATIQLNEGDIITVPGELDHAYLEPVDVPKAARPKKTAPKAATTTDPAPAAAATSDAPASDTKGN